MSEHDTDPYELLGLSSESTEAEIRKAYRQRSLKVHPDRNPNNPDAARKFHELNQAYELLLDPLRRMAIDAKLRVKRARAERFQAYDNKRKNLVEELEERERAFKKAKVDKQKEEAALWEQTEKIKDQGRKLREEKERKFREQQQKFPADEIEEPTLGKYDNDTTVRVKYAISDHPDLTTSEALGKLFSQFGPADNIVLLLKAPKKTPNKPPKHASGLIPFKRVGDAFAAVCASGRADRGLNSIEVNWVGGKEPKILEWLRKMGKLGTPSKTPTPAASTEGNMLPNFEPYTTTTPSSFSSFPSSFPDSSATTAPITTAPDPASIDYESLTLMRLRQAERERLEREIREQEADE